MRHFTLLFLLFIFGSWPSYAAMRDYPSVKLQALDKSTARTVTFEAKVGTTIEYGSLFIKIQSCRKSEPLEKPESASFLQIWEVPLNAEKSEWIFSGWMFASSPALSAMDHPVYDVWVLDCLEKKKQNAEAKNNETKQKTADQGALEAVESAPAQEREVIENYETTPESEPSDSQNDASTDKTQESSQTIDNSIESVIDRATKSP